MFLAAISTDAGTKLLATRDPAERLRIAHAAAAHSPLPTVTFSDPVAANHLIRWLCTCDLTLAHALSGHTLHAAAPDFPLRAIPPTLVADFAARLHTPAIAEALDQAQLAADPLLQPATRDTLPHDFARLRELYRAAAAQHLGLIALPHDTPDPQPTPPADS